MAGRRTVAIGCATAAIAAGALPSGAAATEAARASTLSVSGGAAKAVTVCGRARRAAVVRQGAPATLRVRLRSRRRAVLTIARCGGGRWSRVSQKRLRARRRLTRRLPTLAAGDLRVRLRVRDRIRTAYVR